MVSHAPKLNWMHSDGKYYGSIWRADQIDMAVELEFTDTIYTVVRVYVVAMTLISFVSLFHRELSPITHMASIATGVCKAVSKHALGEFRQPKRLRGRWGDPESIV